MRLRQTILLTGALAAGLIAGCASQPATRIGANSTLAAQRWQIHENRLQSLDSFTLEARIAASGSYGASGDLRWRQRGDHFVVHFSGPFGSGAVDISGTPGDVEIRTGDQRYHTADPETFLRRHYGWTLPVAGLRYWVLGVPTPARPAANVSYDHNGRALKLLQDGWVIDYDSYQGGDGYALPRHFTLVAGKTEFRIVIDRWSDIAPAASFSG